MKEKDPKKWSNLPNVQPIMKCGGQFECTSVCLALNALYFLQ